MKDLIDEFKKFNKDTSKNQIDNWIKRAKSEIPDSNTINENDDKGAALASLCIEYINNPSNENLTNIENKTLEHRNSWNCFRPKYPQSYQNFMIAKFKITFKENEEFNRRRPQEQLIVALSKLSENTTRAEKMKAHSGMDSTRSQPDPEFNFSTCK